MTSYAPGTPASQILTPQQEMENMRARMAAAGFPPKGSLPSQMPADMGRPGVVQPGPRPGMDRPGMGRPGMGRPGMGKPGTGGVNVGPRPNMTPMAAQQIMPEGRAFKKGGMVGCDWKAPSSKTMRGAARKGKGK